MIPVPQLNDAQVAFGCIDHMPRYKDVPDKFQGLFSNEPHCKLVSKWFYEGLSNLGELGKPRDGVDPVKAARALQAILRSFEPKHEHKQAGVAMLIHEWFIIPEGK